MRIKVVVVGLVLALFALAPVASADSITFTGSSGNLSASAEFTVSGSNLLVTLTNTSTHDVTDPPEVLTGLFFSLDGTLTRISAILATGSTVVGGSTDPGGVVGGEWAYNAGLSGAPGGATQGISSSGLGLFSPGDVFPGTNLQGPAEPDGLQYGITSAVDNPATPGHGDLDNNALIKNSVVFTLGLPQEFDLSSLSSVSFQYGTGLDKPNVPGTPTVPEPASMVLLGTGLLGAGFFRRRRK